MQTNGKYVLTHCEIPNEQAQVTLRAIDEIPINLEQFWLFVPRPTEVLLLHGTTFESAHAQNWVYRVSRNKDSSTKEG